jgi:Zinc carboxypeptidase
MYKLLPVLLLCFFSMGAYTQDLSYYLPKEVTYNKNIPTPKSVINHEVGEWHVTHDRLVLYMKTLAAACPDRIKLESMGFTFESREQVLLIITSPKNHQRLEAIRQQHLLLQKGGTMNLDDMPAVVWMGHSIHGNESSGANAALVGAYHLAAAEGASMDSLLNELVILYDPSFNPDGLQRFSTWANQHRSKNLVTDPNSREFNEVWPGGRFNHYWFDLNRDWLPQVHVESKNRVAWFHKWKPNILTDHHEMGSNASFFFQPGVPSRVNPLTPAKNQELTAKIATFHARFLDKIGSLYYTKEGFDDFYYGKGSTYPDAQGCVGILFEQASSRGHAQQTGNGILKFSFTIRNQFTTERSTLEAARALRKELLAYQHDFFGNVLAANDPTQYVYGDALDKSKTKLFTQLLLKNNIAVYQLGTTLKNEDGQFEAGSSYLVPVNQAQGTLVKTLFEKTLNYKDSLFYDITAWTMPLAFGLPYTKTTNAQKGEPVTQAEKTQTTVGMSSYAYIMDWQDYYAPAALYNLQQQGIQTRLATQAFEVQTEAGYKKFKPGSIIIAVQQQQSNELELHARLQKLGTIYPVTVTAIKSGLAIEGVDLGSNKIMNLSKPQPALLVGNGVNATDAGEIWQLFDQQMDIPLPHLEISIANRIDLAKYNTIIMPGGNYAELNKDKLKAWVQNGGTLICMEEAISWSAQSGISEVRFKKVKSATDSTQRLPYQVRDELEGAQQMSGAIFGADADLTHPLAFGYNTKTVSLFKANRVFMEKSKNAFATPFYYGATPLQSGWASIQNKEAVKNSAAVIVNTVGNGRVINIDNNLCFRGFWLGGTKLLMNAVFFSRAIDLASGRTE